MSTEERVSNNAKQIFTVGIGALVGLVGLFAATSIFAPEGAFDRIGPVKEVMLVGMGALGTLLATLGDKIWGK